MQLSGWLLATVLCGRVLAQEPDCAAEFARILGAIEVDSHQAALDHACGALLNLRGGAAPLLAARASGTLSPGAAEALPLNAAQVKLLERTALELDPREIVTAIEAGLEGDSDAAWRTSALDLLAVRGSAAHFALMVELVPSGSIDDPEIRSVAAAFRAGLIALAKRESGVLAEIRSISLLPEPAGAEVVRALGALEDPQALPWLAEQLPDPERSQAALQAIARTAPRASLEAAEPICEYVRPFLEAEELGRRRWAIAAAGALRDEAATPRLIELLKSTSAPERREALDVLVALTHQRLPADPEVWSKWLADEISWWGSESEVLLADLGSENEARAVRAIDSIARHGLRRDRLARALAGALAQHASPVVRGRACQGLVRLGGTVALADLAAALEDPDEAVRNQAWAALRALSRRSLPLDRQAWEQALASVQ